MIWRSFQWRLLANSLAEVGTLGYRYTGVHLPQLKSSTSEISWLTASEDLALHFSVLSLVLLGWILICFKIWCLLQRKTLPIKRKWKCWNDQDSHSGYTQSSPQLAVLQSLWACLFPAEEAVVGLKWEAWFLVPSGLLRFQSTSGLYMSWRWLTDCFFFSKVLENWDWKREEPSRKVIVVVLTDSKKYEDIQRS